MFAFDLKASGGKLFNVRTCLESIKSIYIFIHEFIHCCFLALFLEARLQRIEHVNLVSQTVSNPHFTPGVSSVEQKVTSRAPVSDN